MNAVESATFSDSSEARVPKETLRSWIVCLVAGLLFFYEFIQMNMFNAISPKFMASLHILPGQMGMLDSFYFIANVIFLIPAGYLLDRYPIRRVILISMLVCVMGTAAMALTNTLWLAMFFRFLTGIGSAFCFLSCIRLSTHWFSPKRIGLVIGVIVTEAMLGGVVSQTPLAMLTDSFSWQTALLFDAAFGMVIWAVIYAVVTDHPKGYKPQKMGDDQSNFTSYSSGFRRAFLTAHNWMVGAYTALMNFPLAVFGGIWGISYLTTRFGISSISASEVTSMLFFGMMLGSPLAGYLSDICERRGFMMVAGGVGLCGLMLLLIMGGGWSMWALMALFFFIGLASGAQVIGYPAVAERSPVEIVAMSVSVVNISVQSGQGIVKPLFGQLMDWHAHQAHHAASLLTAADYQFASWLLPVCVVLAMVSVFVSQRRRANSKQ